MAFYSNCTFFLIVVKALFINHFGFFFPPTDLEGRERKHLRASVLNQNKLGIGKKCGFLTIY